MGKVSSGGVIIMPEVEEAFKTLKMGKRLSNRYIVFKMEDCHSKISVEHEGGIDESLGSAPDSDKRKETHKEFIKHLPNDDCRFAVVDCDKTIFFVLWTPDDASVKKKMIYTSSKEHLKFKLPGCDGTSIEAHELADLERLVF